MMPVQKQCRTLLVFGFGLVLLLSGCQGSSRTSIALDQCFSDGDQTTLCLLGEDYYDRALINLGHSAELVTTRKWISIYRRSGTEKSPRKIAELPLDKDSSYDVVSCDDDAVTVLDYGPYATDTPHRLLRLALRGGKSETVVAGRELGTAIKTANDDSLVVEWQDNFRIIDAKKRTYYEFPRLGMSLWSCDRDQLRILVAGTSGTPLNPCIIGFSDKSTTYLGRPHKNQTPCAAFFIDGEPAHLVVDHNGDQATISLYDAKDQLRSSVPVPPEVDSWCTTYSITLRGGVRFIGAHGIRLASREQDLFSTCMIMRCDGWSLTRIE